MSTSPFPWRIEDLVISDRGTSALLLALMVGIPDGGTVLMPANICEIVPLALTGQGYRVRFHDVDPTTGLARLADIAGAYRNDDALIAVHNFGRALEIEAITAWAGSRSVFLIEDICNAPGATRQGQPLGQNGDASIMSFSHAKIVDVGFGGAVWFADGALRVRAADILASWPPFDDPAKVRAAEILEALRRFQATAGRRDPAPMVDVIRSGLNFRLGRTEITGIATALMDLAANLRHRRTIADTYRSRIRATKFLHPDLASGDVVWRYTGLWNDADGRDELLQSIRKAGLFASTWYPPIDHLFSGRDRSSFQGATRFGNRVVNLPVDERVGIGDAIRLSELINGH